MVNKRIYQLSDAIATSGRYLPVDKSGNSEAERVLLSSILPSTIYRCNTESIAAGEQTITFLEAFPAGTSYAILPIWGWNDDFGNLGANPYDKTVNGFKINFGEAVEFTYLAIIIR
jgi:hypothetical protein